MPDEDISQSAAPPSEAPIQTEPAPEAPIEPVGQIESMPIASNVPDASVPTAQASSSDASESTPILAPISDPALPTKPEPIPIVQQSESIPISVVPPSVPQVAPQIQATWNPHSTEEINYLKTVLGPKAWASHRIHMQTNLDKVMELARKKGTIDRTDVRLHLEVSQATATRYLTELVHEGKLVRQHTQNDNVYTVK